MKYITELFLSMVTFFSPAVYATDTYNHVNNQLTIPVVVVGDTIYRDVVITVGSILTVGGSNLDSKYPAKPGNTMDSYDPYKNQLTIPNVSAYGFVYYDVVINVGTVLSVKSGEPKNKDIACTEQSSLNSLNAEPVYNFSGLTSNWYNSKSVFGADSSQNFVIAFSNFSSVAKEKNDAALKSTLVSNLHRWAAADAFKGSKLCWNPRTGWDSTCTQWIDPQGNDLSAIQDNNFIMEMVESIRPSYSLISDWAKENEPTKHSKIMSWLDFWDVNTPDPDNVFFGLGMGRYHWEIRRITDKSGVAATTPLVRKLMQGILPLVNEDGSIKDRTTRGNRAMWYHFSSLNEIMTSMYLAKLAGVAIDPILENRLHKAVEIFINTLDDPAHIVKWAKVGHNNGGDGTAQNFNFTNWYDGAYAGSWIYLYVNWYPSNNNTARLSQKVPLNTAKSASQDRQFGIPLGCLLF